MNKSLLLIKLGGSVITDKNKPYTSRLRVLRRLAKELKTIQQPLIITHGSGSYGHTSAHKFGGMKGYLSKEGIAKVAFDAAHINFIVMEELIAAGIPAISFRPMSMMTTAKGNLHSFFFEGIKEALSQQLTPVVYGDVIFDTDWKSTIYSGEKILGILAKYLQRNGFPLSKIIEVGSTHGVYDNKGKTIPSISRRNWPSIKPFIRAATNDVSGGMMHKIEEALKMSKYISTHIINGNLPNQISAILQDEPVLATVIE